MFLHILKRRSNEIEQKDVDGGDDKDNDDYKQETKRMHLTTTTDSDQLIVLKLPRIQFDDWKHTLEEVEHKKQESLRIRTRVEVTLDDLRDQRSCNGDIRLANLRRTLDSVPGFARSEHQKEFHEAFIQACLPHIYENDWENNAVRVMESLGLQRIQHEVLIATPRRWGKTISVAMFVAALLLCRPGIKIAVFSTGKRASSSLTGEVIKMIDRLGHKNRIVKQNLEELYVSIVPAETGGGTQSAKALQTAPETSRLGSFPSSVEGNVNTNTSTSNTHTF